MLKYLALAAIRIYQTVLSPYKGFRCAYAATTGCATCSALGYRAIRRLGVRKGIELLRWRFEACGEAYRSIPPKKMRALGHQRGDCDLDCDFGSCKKVGSAAECIADFGSSCGGGGGREKKPHRRPKKLPRT